MWRRCVGRGEGGAGHGEGGAGCGEGGAGRGPALPLTSPSPHHHCLLKSALFPLLCLS